MKYSEYSDEKVIVEMIREDDKIYIKETTIFYDKTYVTNKLQVLHDDTRGYYVILPDLEIISADKLKTIYHARKNIMIRYNDSEFWCYLNEDKPYRYF